MKRKYKIFLGHSMSLRWVVGKRNSCHDVIAEFDNYKDAQKFCAIKNKEIKIKR
jgi:hypothetical protein